MNTLTLTPNFKLSENKKDVLIAMISYLCLFLFMYTAYTKLADHERFYNGLSNVHLISRWAFLASLLRSVWEILVSILLIVPKRSKPG